MWYKMSTYNKTNNIFFTQSVQHIAKDCCVVKNFFEHVAATLGQCFKQSSTMKIWGVCKRSASCETKIRHTGNDIVDYKVYTCQDKKNTQAERFTLLLNSIELDTLLGKQFSAAIAP